MRELAPYAGVVAALGVALLMLARPVPARLAGIALFGVGVVGVGLYREPEFRDRLTDRPRSGARQSSSAWPRSRRPASCVALDVAAPALLAVAGLRIPYSWRPHADAGPGAGLRGGRARARGLAWRLLRGRARPVRLGPSGRPSRPSCCSARRASSGSSTCRPAPTRCSPSTCRSRCSPRSSPSSTPSACPWPGRSSCRSAWPSLFALVGIYQWATETIWWNDLLETANRYTSSFRVNSLFISPAPFGRFEALALITIVALLALGPPRRAIVALAPAGPLLLVGLALSFSRTAMVAMVAGLIVLSLVVWRRPAAIALGVGAVLAIVLALALPQTRDAFSGGGEELSSNRLSLSERGFEEFKERPLHGVGLGGFVAGSRLLEEKTRRGHSPHNVVLTTAAELGVLGLRPWPRCSRPRCTPPSGRATPLGGACCGWWWRSSSA